MTVSATYKWAISTYRIEDECPICLEDFDADSRITLLACQHILCPGCTKTQKSCPECNAPINPPVTKLESGYASYELLYQLITKNPHIHEWTPKEIEETVMQLKIAVSTHHQWNRYVRLFSFEHLCALLEKNSPSEESAQAIELFFQEIIKHEDYKIISGYLEEQQRTLTPPLWHRMVDIFSLVTCIPNLQ